VGNRVFVNPPVDEKAIASVATVGKVQTPVASRRSGDVGSATAQKMRVKKALIERKLS
jgi:hypothetical protein